MQDASEATQPTRRLKSLSTGERLWLLGILAVGLLLRVTGIGWGLPPATPETAASGFRGTYAFDEVSVLYSLARTDPVNLDFDPKLYRWGTLHLELVLLALEGAQAVGVFEKPWRTAFGGMIPGEFEKVYVVGRLVSVALDLATVLLTFLLAAMLRGRHAGLWAAALVALSPGHILQAVQIRVDVTETTFVTLTAVLGLRLLARDRRRLWLAFGIAAGLAMAAKYSSAPMVLGAAAVALWPHRFAWSRARWWLLGVVAGFLAGEPFILTNFREVLDQASKIVQASRQAIPEHYYISKPALLGQHVVALARFSLGIPAALLAGWGFWLLGRRGSPAGWMAPVMFIVGLITLLPQNWPLLRYQLPLVPFCAAAAAVALDSLRPRWRWMAALLALGVALAASATQLRYMLSPHPLNLALAEVPKKVPRGQTIARIMREVPPLDESAYPMGPNPFLDDLAQTYPSWVLTADLLVGDYPHQNKNLFETHYEKVAVFRSPLLFPWATLGEAGAPHDWRYTHPTTILYKLR